MVYTIPNVADATHADQAELHSRDIDILVAGFDGYGVLSGCAVTAQGSPDNTVAVAAGWAISDGALARVTAGNVTMTAAHASLPRLDLVSVSAAGVKTWTAGTADGNPTPPAIPSGHVALAVVYVPANDNVVNSTQIIDKRVVLGGRPSLLTPRIITGQYYSSLSLMSGDTTSNRTILANWHWAFPIAIFQDATFDRIGIDVNTAGAGGTVARLMLYADDGTGGRPGTLILDAGTVAVDSTGFKEITISQALQRGIVWGALASDGGPVIEAAVFDYATMLGHSTTFQRLAGWSKNVGNITAQDPFPTDSAKDGTYSVGLVCLRAV